MRDGSERFRIFMKRLELSDDPAAKEYLRYSRWGRCAARGEGQLAMWGCGRVCVWGGEGGLAGGAISCQIRRARTLRALTALHARPPPYGPPAMQCPDAQRRLHHAADV